MMNILRNSMNANALGYNTSMPLVKTIFGWMWERTTMMMMEAQCDNDSKKPGCEFPETPK